jgi:hypothetical protein
METHSWQIACLPPLPMIQVGPWVEIYLRFYVALVNSVVFSRRLSVL